MNKLWGAAAAAAGAASRRRVIRLAFRDMSTFNSFPSVLFWHDLKRGTVCKALQHSTPGANHRKPNR